MTLRRAINYCVKCDMNSHQTFEVQQTVLKAQHTKWQKDILDFFREIDPDLCQYAYDFHETGFTSS